MKAAGWILLVSGAVIAFFAFILETSVPDYSLGADRIVNIAKLQVQTLTFGCGAVLFLAGAIFIGFGAVIEKLGEAASPVVHDAEDPLSQVARWDDERGGAYAGEEQKL